MVGFTTSGQDMEWVYSFNPGAHMRSKTDAAALPLLQSDRPWHRPWSEQVPVCQGLHVTWLFPTRCPMAGFPQKLRWQQGSLSGRSPSDQSRSDAGTSSLRPTRSTSYASVNTQNWWLSQIQQANLTRHTDRQRSVQPHTRPQWQTDTIDRHTEKIDWWHNLLSSPLCQATISLRFNGPFSRWTLVSQFLQKQSYDGRVLTTGATRCAELQSNCHHQQTNTQIFAGRMPFLSPNPLC